MKCSNSLAMIFWKNVAKIGATWAKNAWRSGDFKCVLVSFEKSTRVIESQKLIGLHQPSKIRQVFWGRKLFKTISLGRPQDFPESAQSAQSSVNSPF